MTVVGAEVEGKVNWLVVGHTGVIGHDRILVSMSTSHYTNQGIKKSKRLSVNLVSREMLPKADYVGSGVCIDYCANEIVEAVGFINIHHFTFHRERRCVDDGRTVFASMVSEDLRFIDLRTADASDIVGFR